MNMTIPYFEVKVVEIGFDAELMFEENMMILFNDTVPSDLKSIAIVHNGQSLTKEIKAGDEMVVDGEAYKLLFVGDKVNETMKDLGHATFQFNGETQSDLPGTVCLEDKPMPEINKNSVISFRSL